MLSLFSKYWNIFGQKITFILSEVEMGWDGLRLYFRLWEDWSVSGFLLLIGFQPKAWWIYSPFLHGRPWTEISCLSNHAFIFPRLCNLGLANKTEGKSKDKVLLNGFPYFWGLNLPCLCSPSNSVLSLNNHIFKKLYLVSFLVFSQHEDFLISCTAGDGSVSHS